MSSNPSSGIALTHAGAGSIVELVQQVTDGDTGTENQSITVYQDTVNRELHLLFVADDFRIRRFCGIAASYPFANPKRRVSS